MNNNYVYALIGKGRKRHIVRDHFLVHGSGYAICGMGGQRLSPAEQNEPDCVACLKKLARIRR